MKSMFFFCIRCMYMAASSGLEYLCSVLVIMMFSNIHFGALLPVGSCEMLNAAKLCCSNICSAAAAALVQCECIEHCQEDLASCLLLYDVV